MKEALKTEFEPVWNQLLPHSARANGKLQDALRTRLVGAILNGRIPRNSRLPSTRALSSLLNVARITVALTYERLATEGYLEPRPRRGYFVSPEVPEGIAVPQQGRSRSPKTPDWARCLHLSDQQSRWLQKPRNWQTYRFPFVYGQPNPTLFPLREWRECSRLAQAGADSSRWAADAIDADDPMLITAIIQHVLTKRGIVAGPGEVLITLGTQMALYLLAELLTTDRTAVAIEDPGYMDLRNMLFRRRADLRCLHVDENGVVLSDVLKRCSCFFCTPSHQCPTGVTLSLERRVELLRLSEIHDFIVIEDDYEAESRFVGPPSPALKAMDRPDRVIYMGSFSKILSPGLRIGYIVGPAALIDAARRLRRLIIRHPPNNNQRALALFIDQGHYDRLLFRNRASLQSRASRLSAACRDYLPGWTFREPLGGSALWMQVPNAISAAALTDEARRRGVLIEPGAAFFASSENGAHFVRLAYSSIPLEDIRPGIEELAKAARASASRKVSMRGRAG